MNGFFDDLLLTLFQGKYFLVFFQFEQWATTRKIVDVLGGNENHLLHFETNLMAVLKDPQTLDYLLQLQWKANWLNLIIHFRLYQVFEIKLFNCVYYLPRLHWFEMVHLKKLYNYISIKPFQQKCLTLGVTLTTSWGNYSRSR